MSDFDKKLSEALKRVGFHKGLEFDEEHGIMTVGKYTNDYLAVLYLARLLEDGQLEIKIAKDNVAYLRKLLKMGEER